MASQNCRAVRLFDNKFISRHFKSLLQSYVGCRWGIADGVGSRAASVSQPAAQPAGEDFGSGGEAEHPQPKNSSSPAMRFAERPNATARQN